MDYSKAFRIIRAAFGLSQAELSGLLDIGPSQVSLIESGKRQPSHKVIRELADKLEIPVSLISLLASEPRDLEVEERRPLEVLGMSLLKLLVSASGEKFQSKVRSGSSEDGHDG
jgi:transcriptional regulator with XRE-family HTH domain